MWQHYNWIWFTFQPSSNMPPLWELWRPELDRNTKPWYHDILQCILIQLRTRPACTSFKWVKGHANNYGNNQADCLADLGRASDLEFIPDDEQWVQNHPALQDGARLQAIETKHTYKILLAWHTRKVKPILHQEVLDNVKDKLEQFTGLQPTNK